jgi:nitrate/TMAO reductase-like tetraheme cytochrome c subunit
MAARDRLASWSRPLAYLGRNPVTLTGAVLTTSAALTMIGFWALEMMTGRPMHPYSGIVLFLILPAIFVLGLVLMPVGALLRRRKLRAQGELPREYPQLDFRQPVLRNAALMVLAATMMNVVILGVATYKGMEHMDSPQFCGVTCHQVMAPEYTAYANSPHSRVPCVECHVGPGARGFVHAKLAGTRQLWEVTFNSYSRPIPVPVDDLRPARETCEHCHWPQKFHGDKLTVRTRFSDDEANSRLITVLMLRIGGHSDLGATGIHGRHLAEASRIRYESTDGRQVIPRVTYVDDSGKLVEFVSAEATQASAGKERETREMDCIDCHNRPTHNFQLPERAVDRSLAEGRISAGLPFVRKKAVELLRADYPDQDTAGRRIVDGLGAFYQASYPAVYKDRRSQVDAAAAEVKAIYLRNIFPEMKVAWGTYANNIGHEDFPGCFRCHDDQHKSADGKAISQDCDACHSTLAMEEANPKVLADLGLK